MAEIQHLLNGTPCNPTNRNEIEYVADFTARSSGTLELSVDSLRFVMEDFDAIKTYRSVYGDYVGMPYSITYQNNLTVQYMLDFTDPSTVTRSRSIDAKLIKYKGKDNFYDNAEGLSFGQINWITDDFHDVDYIIVPQESILYYISLGLATFSLSQELGKSIQEISEGIADVVQASIPVGLPVPSPNWGAIIMASIKLAARIAYTIFIIIALIKLTTEILNIIFPKVRQFKGIKLKKLIEKGCQHLGYTFQSTLLDGIIDAVILPVPLRAKDPSFWKELFQPLSLAYTEGYPSVRDPAINTLGRAIKLIEDNFNGELRVEANDVVRLELESYYEQQASSQMSEAFNLQGDLEDETTINSDEIFNRLVITYEVDPSDTNTYDDSKKTLFESASVIQNSTGISYERINKYKGANIPIARGTRKGTLTFAEKTAKVYAKAIDLFCGTNLAAKVEERKDKLQISEQYFGVTKLLYMNGSNLVENQNAFIGCDVIAQNYWTAKYIQNNQKTIKNNMPLELTENEFFNFLGNNYVNLDNGDVVKVTRIAWSDHRNMSSIDYEKKKLAINESTTVINAG